MRRFQKLNRQLDPEALSKIRWDFEGTLDIIVFQGGDDGRGYRNMYKIPPGSNSKYVCVMLYTLQYSTGTGTGTVVYY